MGMRFRRSVKILPGVRINFSKSGMSTTIGPKGASVNIGKKGTYLNTGIPGTGLYMREKIGGGKAATRQVSSSSGKSKGYDPEFLRRYELYKPVTIKINSSGKITIEDKNGDVITDEFFLKKMKATPDFKAQKEQLVSQWRERGEQEYQEAQNALAELVNIHRYSFTVKTMEDYERELAAIPQKKYQKKAFDQKEPSRHEIETSLTAYANLHVTSKAFWRVKKLREEYIQENLEPQYQKQHAEWEKKKQEFEQRQNKEAETQNAFYAAEYEKACAAMKDKIRTVIDENGRRNDCPEFPLKAVREVVLNALIHRDYSSYSEGTPIMLAMYKDRMEVINKGGLYGRVSVSRLGFTHPDTRNPSIAGIMETLDQTENRYSGIPTIRAEMKKANLREPVFQSKNGEFKVILYNSEKNAIQPEETGNLSPKERKLLEFCSIPRTRTEISQHMGSTWTNVKNGYISRLISSGLLRMTKPETPKVRDQQFVAIYRLFQDEQMNGQFVQNEI